ncbi:MAG: hypothetical protein U9Q07_04040 [Planctomycetota bacterium]|nr:hypothetical protein [Planctomycetota bacterium]
MAIFADIDTTVRDFRFRVLSDVETMLSDMFPTDDAMADAVFAGGAVMYYPLKLTDNKIIQRYKFGYPDEGWDGMDTITD